MSKSPPTSIGINIHGVPIHHDALCSEETSEIARTDPAAGLNICLFSTVGRYFIAIARAEAAAKNVQFSDNLGVIISERIKAVIKTDSIFVAAWKIFANSLFAIYPAVTVIPTLPKISSGLYDKNESVLKTTE